MKKNTIWLLGAAALGLYLWDRNKKKQELEQPSQPQKLELTPEQKKAVQQISDSLKAQSFKLR